jgi:flagellar biosynthesis/type III secretory pathway chaperone
MEIEISCLLEILDKQKKLIDELLNLASEQLQALKLDDLNKITSLTARQEYIKQQLALLEQKRHTIIEQYSRKRGVEIKYLSELLYIENNDSAEVKKIRKEIIDSCQKLKEVHALNSLLLKQGLKYTERVWGVLNSQNSLIYSKSGDVQRAVNRVIIDTSA